MMRSLRGRKTNPTKHLSTVREAKGSVELRGTSELGVFVIMGHYDIPDLDMAGVLGCNPLLVSFE